MTIALVAVAIGVWLVAGILLALFGILSQAVTALSDMRMQLRTLATVSTLAAAETHAIRVAATSVAEGLAKPWNMLVMVTPPADPSATKH